MTEKYTLKIEKDTYLLFLELREVHRRYMELICSSSSRFGKPNFVNEAQELDYLFYISVCDELMFLEEQVEKFSEVKSSE